MRIPGTFLVLSALMLSGCHGRGGSTGKAPTPAKGSNLPAIRHVVSLFDHRPWWNADVYGDRDPEGIRFRVFLDDGHEKGVLREGTFHVTMYELTRESDGKVARNLVSDWHYPTRQFPVIDAKIMGKGYHLTLRWARKDLAGKEIELITEFEGIDGQKARSGTKRFSIPKYMS